MTHTANPVITATTSATCTVVAVFLYVLLLLYLSLTLTPQKLAYYHTFALTLNSLRMSVLNSSYDSFIDIVGFRTAKF